MTAWLGDRTLTHLRDVADWPDLGSRYEIIDRIGHVATGAGGEFRSDVPIKPIIIEKATALP